MKPGWKTTEWWATVASTVIALLVAVGVFTAEDAKGVDDAALKAVTALGAFLTNAFVVARYVTGRSDLKAAELNLSHEAAVLNPPSSADDGGFADPSPN